MNWVDALLDRRRFRWLPVSSGESGDLVYRREDGLVFAKAVPAARVAALCEERDRLVWLRDAGIACPQLVDWRETEGGVCVVMTAVPGVPASELSGADLLTAWPSIARQLGALHALPVEQCPFDRSLARMFERARDVVSRSAVNPDFLPDEDKNTPPSQLLARIAPEMPTRLRQESSDRVVCHGDACMPNFLVDPATLQCTGVIDLGRLGVADRYVDLALMLANAQESWESADQSQKAFDILFRTLGIAAPDRERLTFYLRLDPLTWDSLSPPDHAQPAAPVLSRPT